MELSKQVTSLELSKRLKELDVKQESLYEWSLRWRWQEEDIQRKVYSDNEGGIIQPTYNENSKGSKDKYGGQSFWAAFTVAELGEMLPTVMKLQPLEYQEGHLSLMHLSKWYVGYARAGQAAYPGEVIHESLAEACGLMLAYLLENKLLDL